MQAIVLCQVYQQGNLISAPLLNIYSSICECINTHILCIYITILQVKSNQSFLLRYQSYFKLSCKDTFVNQMLAFVVAGSLEVGSFLCIMTSYICILSALCRIGSSKRIKPLSTCASHFTCVAMFYCPVFFTYLRPNSAYSVEQDWVVSVFYTLIIPMLNPIIYSLRNQDVKQALTKLMASTMVP